MGTFLGENLHFWEHFWENPILGECFWELPLIFGKMNLLNLERFLIVVAVNTYNKALYA